MKDIDLKKKEPNGLIWRSGIKPSGREAIKKKAGRLLMVKGEEADQLN